MSAKSHHINPDRNTPWNTLPLLPPPQELYYTTALLEKLIAAKTALAKVQGRSIVLPNQGLLINSISLQEAKASSAIENIFTTDDELYQAYSEEQHPENIAGAPKEVLRYREALWKGFTYLKNSSSFDSQYFIELYREVKNTQDSIRPAFLETVIKQGGSGLQAGKVVYTPPRGKGIIENKLSNLIDFINDDEQYAIDPLLKMAIAHYQFETIHPFRDGNGRVGRIFNIHVLTQKDLLDFPILFLSRYIITHKEEYYERLAGVSQRGEWYNWIAYMLKAVEETAHLTYTKINAIVAAKEAIQQAIENDTAIRRAGQLTELIFEQPFTKVKHLTDRRMYAENTARNYLQTLCTMGILEKKLIQGNHYYLNLELYSILSE